MILVRDLAPDRALAIICILRHKNGVVTGYRINDIGVIWSFSGGCDGVPAYAWSGRRKRPVTDRCPYYRRSCSIQGADNALACCNQMLWRSRVHAKGREKVAGTVFIKLRRPNITLRSRRCSWPRPGNSPDVSPIHGEVSDSAIHRVDSVMG